MVSLLLRFAFYSKYRLGQLLIRCGQIDLRYHLAHSKRSFDTIVKYYIHMFYVSWATDNDYIKKGINRVKQVNGLIIC